MSYFTPRMPDSTLSITSGPIVNDGRQKPNIFSSVTNSQPIRSGGNGFGIPQNCHRLLGDPQPCGNAYELPNRTLLTIPISLSSSEAVLQQPIVTTVPKSGPNPIYTSQGQLLPDSLTTSKDSVLEDLPVNKLNSSPLAHLPGLSPTAFSTPSVLCPDKHATLPRLEDRPLLSTPAPSSSSDATLSKVSAGVSGDKARDRSGKANNASNIEMYAAEASCSHSQMSDELAKAKQVAEKISAEVSKKSWVGINKYSNTHRNHSQTGSSRKINNNVVSSSLADNAARKPPDVEIKVPKNMMLSDYCKLCDVQLLDAFMAKAHYVGKRHSNRENQYIKSLCKTMDIDAERYLTLTRQMQSSSTEDGKSKEKIDTGQAGSSSSGSDSNANANYNCFLCNLGFDSYDQVQAHVQTPSHISNIRDYENKLKRPAGVDSGASQQTKKKAKGSNEEFFCNLCEKAMNSSQQYDLHIASKKHNKRKEDTAKEQQMKQKFKTRPIKQEPNNYYPPSTDFHQRAHSGQWSYPGRDNGYY